MKLPVTIDPRYHDAVLFNLDVAPNNDVPFFRATVDLARKLQGVGVATAACSSNSHCQQILKALGVDDLFDACIDGTVVGGLGLAGKGGPPVLLWGPPPPGV